MMNRLLVLFSLLQLISLACSRLLGPEDYGDTWTLEKEQLANEDSHGNGKGDDQQLNGVPGPQQVKARQFGLGPPMLNQQPQPMMDRFLPYCDEIEVQEKDSLYRTVVWLVLVAILAVAALAGFIYLRNVHSNNKRKRRS